MPPIKIKRIYEKPEEEDGYRILVDRLWPRGVKKENAALDEWNKNVAPSTPLRKWFAHDEEKFNIVSEKYREELKEQLGELKRLRSISREQPLTLLYAAKNETINHAIVLLESLKKTKL